MNRRTIVGLGAGGHARSVLDALLSTNQWDIAGLLDSDQDLWGREVLGFVVLGDDSKLAELRDSSVTAAFIGVGGAQDNSPRASIYKRLEELGFDMPVIRHRTAVIAPSASIGAATVVLAGSLVNAQAQLGSNVIINTGAIVEHECVIGDHCHIATGARLGGRVQIGNMAHVGIGAVVLQGVRIGEGAVIGAGAVVLNDVPPRTVAVGIPARPIKQRA